MKQHMLTVKGYGCDLFVGGMSSKAHNYFISRKIDFDDYAFNLNFKPTPRVKYLPFSPGKPYTGNCLFEGRGAFLGVGGTIEVFDEQMERVWRCPISLNRLSEAGVCFKIIDAVAPVQEICEVGYYVADFTKGLQCIDNFSTKNHFNPSQIRLDFLRFMDMVILFKVQYGRRVLDDSQGDTKGMGAHAALVRFG